MKTNRRNNKRGFTLVELLVVIVIIAALAALTAPMVIRQRKKADRTEATNNAKQIGIALFEFDTDYGGLPGTATLAQLPAGAVTGSTSAGSNGYFRMLMQAGITESEKMFYAKARGTVKPDGVISPVAEALKAREVGFGYVSIGTEGLSSAGNATRPVVMSPLTPGATTFDPGPFDRELVVLRMDQSAENLKLTVAAGATVGTLPPGDKDIFATANAIWGGETPTINAPQTTAP